MPDSYWKVAYFLLVSAANLTLVLIVYLKNRRHLVNRLFALSVLWVVFWTISDYFLHVFADSTLATLWGRVTFATASLIPASFLSFATVFPSDQKLPRDWLVSSSTALGILFFLLSFSPFLVADVRHEDRGLRLIYGPIYPAFALYFLLCFATSFRLLWRKYGVAHAVDRLRMRYLFLGTLLAVAGGATTNLLIPLFARTSRFSFFGPAFTVFAFTFVAHAILRYRLMDIRVVIRKGVVYVTAVAVVASVFLGSGKLLIMATNYDKHSIPLLAGVAMALLLAIVFQPLKAWIQAALNRYVYRESYDYQRIVRQASRKFSALLDLQALLNYLTDVIATTLRVEVLSIYLRDHPQDRFSPQLLHLAPASHRQPSCPLPSPTSPLISHLEVNKTLVIAEEALQHSEDPSLVATANELRALGGEIAIPFSTEQSISGFLVVGPKLSGDPYFSEDIDLLVTLASQAAIAIENAQLYRQVVLVNEYVENILATMESGVIAVAADGTVTLFNSAAERLTKLEAKQIKGKPLQLLPSAIAEPLEATVTDGEPRTHFETLIQDGAGAFTPAICATTTLRDRSGTILGAVSVFSDLTKLKELEGEKRRAERLASIGALASGVAHEIKNPLVAIRTFAELLPERFAEDDFRNDFSKIVYREIERIDDLVARLRGLATPSPQAFILLDTRGPIEETLALMRGQLERARITVHRAYEKDLPPIAGDPAQLKQLFLNLFANALEAMGPNGNLSIRLSKREQFGKHTLIAEVADTGAGIPEVILDKLFKPFVTTKSRGSGLGLSICKGIADSHGATIHAKNNSNGIGATVFVEFPIAQRILAELPTS